MKARPSAASNEMGLRDFAIRINSSMFRAMDDNARFCLPYFLMAPRRRRLLHGVFH